VTYHVRARNTATDSENTIHADDVARQFGFHRGLVPGVTVFGYMMKPVIERLGLAWFDNGRIELKLEQPVYDDDEIVLRVQGESPVRISAERDDGTICARAEASIESVRAVPNLELYPERCLPEDSDRPKASLEALAPGTVLGTLRQRLDMSQSRVFAALGEANPIYFGANAVVHPAVLLELANHVLLRNFRLGPWLHASSTVVNWSPARNGEAIQVRSRVSDRFERKGHAFVVLDLVVLGEEPRLIQHVIHTAIYRPKFVTS
jgi:hypothetical protein